MSEMHVLKEFRATLDQFVEADEFSGAVLVAKDQTILFQQAYGMAHQGYGFANQVDTKLNLGSMNKMFTAVAIAQLAEQGRLAFSEQVGKYLPDYPREVAEKITIHHLLTHTSGLGSFWNERFFATWADLRTVDDYLPLFRDDPLSFEPGEKFQYSNAGFVLLGAIIEHVTGQDYFLYVREHLYEPVGMHNTDAYEMDHSIPNLALGYTHQTPTGKQTMGPRRNHPVGKGGPAGGGYSTVEDLFKFSLAVRSYRLLEPSSTTTLLAGKGAIPDKPGITYAYGWQNVTINGHRIVGHGGGAPGISAQFDLYLDLGYTVVVLANYDPPIAPRIASILREQLTS